MLYIKCIRSVSIMLIIIIMQTIVLIPHTCTKSNVIFFVYKKC